MLIILYVLIFLQGVQSNKNVCVIGLDCDQYCINKYGNNTQSAAKELTNIIQSGIYPYYDNRLNKINFQIGQIRMYPNQYFKIPNVNAMLELYGSHLIRHNIVGCLNLLFSEIADIGIHGIAYINRLCNHYNVGIVKLNADWTEIVITTAHEIGHILGAHHTCEIESDDITKTCNYKSGDTCNPTGDNKYLMFPIIKQCSKNSKRFSQCSIDTINQLYNQYTCLTSSNSTLTPIYFNHICPQSHIYIIFSIATTTIIGGFLIYYMLFVIKNNKQ
jgi:hypothetical protein